MRELLNEEKKRSKQRNDLCYVCVCDLNLEGTNEDNPNILNKFALAAAMAEYRLSTAYLKPNNYEQFRQIILKSFRTSDESAKSAELTKTFQYEDDLSIFSQTFHFLIKDACALPAYTKTRALLMSLFGVIHVEIVIPSCTVRYC